MLLMSGRDGGSEEKFEFPRGFFSYLQLNLVVGIGGKIGLTTFYSNLRNVYYYVIISVLK